MEFDVSLFLNSLIGKTAKIGDRVFSFSRIAGYDDRVRMRQEPSGVVRMVSTDTGVAYSYCGDVTGQFVAQGFLCDLWFTDPDGPSLLPVEVIDSNREAAA